MSIEVRVVDDNSYPINVYWRGMINRVALEEAMEMKIGLDKAIGELIVKAIKENKKNHLANSF